MTKIWEYSRRPQIVTTDMVPATIVRAEMREKEEPIAIVVTDTKSMKLTGYITWREAIQITSHYSSLRAKDIAIDYPIALSKDDVSTVVEAMEGEKIIALPIVKDTNTLEVIGIITVFDIIRGLLKEGYEPIAKSVAEVATTEHTDKYVTTIDERVNKVWSDLVYRGIPGKIVVRSMDQRYPIGLVSLREFIATSRWFFHRESEHGLRSIAKVKSIMLRGVPVASPDTPIEYVAKTMVDLGLLVLPVIDPDKGELISVITVYDVLGAYVKGAKPGRVRPVVKIPLPIQLKEEEKITYTSTHQVLQQVSVVKPVVESLTGVRVEDVMRPELPAITINDTVEHARRLMLETRTPYILVIDENGEIVGVVSKWSMLRAIGRLGPLWRRRPSDKYFIEYIMDQRLPKLRIGTSIEEASLAMVEEAAEVAIVIDEDGSIQGFITKDDIIEAYYRTGTGRAKVENVMTSGRLGIVHPHHSLAHVVKRMETFYLDALTVYDGIRIHGVVSANRLPFIAIEDSVEGLKSRRLIWVRKLVRSAARMGRYVKITPLLAIDATARISETIYPDSDVVEAIRLMKKLKIDGIPVVDKNGRVLGVICKNDIVREFARTAHQRIARGLPVKLETQREKNLKNKRRA